MPLVSRATWLLQIAGIASALNTARRDDAAVRDALANDRPGEPLYGWVAGDERGSGGPEQVSGGAAFAAGRQVPHRAEQMVATGGRSKSKSRFPSHLQARIILPKAKLAFCYMPKVASSQMASLFGDLNKVHDEGWLKEPWAYSGTSRFNIDWNDVTKENGWKFAFFTRDPLARYLSAFGSKCMMNANNGVVEGGGKDCLGKIMWTQVTMETMIEAFEERVQADAKEGRPANNSHWFPMIKNLRACGIDRFHPSLVDFHGSLDENANAELKLMFKNTGVLEAYPDAEKLVDNYFPIENLGGHFSHTHNRQDVFYRNASTVQAVAKLYEEDYARLNLTLKVPPQWKSLLLAQ